MANTFLEGKIFMNVNSKKHDKNIEPIIRESKDEICGMWKDKDIDPLTYARELRKGRQFDFSGCNFSELCPPKNTKN